MKISPVFIILSFLLLTSPAPAENLKLYKYCHAIYQSIQARKLDLNRLIRTVKFHQKAFQRFKASKQDNLANFHKQHLNYVQLLLNKQEQQYKMLKISYDKKCPYNSDNSDLSLSQF